MLVSPAGARYLASKPKPAAPAAPDLAATGGCRLPRAEQRLKASRPGTVEVHRGHLYITRWALASQGRGKSTIQTAI